METYRNEPLLLFATYQELDAWLEKHHDKIAGLWIKFAKKSSGIASITYEEARDTAICHGWIDGLKNALDETYYTIRFTPRKPKSIWSKVNVGVVENLIRDKRMKPAGLAQVELAKADGRWAAAYDSQKTMEMPQDFQKLLDANPKASAFYNTLTKGVKYGYLWRLQNAKKAETRERKMKEFVENLAKGETIHLIKKKES
jgi:uncharacterized protein YdeI (YjbR/CyaY-like superfamily)